MIPLAMAFTACAPTEVDDLFDDSAANRLDKAVSYYSDYFTSQGGKWEMLYFANEEEMGFYFVVTFNENGSVTISGDNPFIAGGTNSSGAQEDHDMSVGYVSDTSLWSVSADDGPSISFNSLNKAFHFFSDPGVIPPGSSRANGGGHEGDFEFTIVTTDDNTATLRGKKHGMTIIMNRLPASTDDEAYVAQRTAMQAAHFSTNVRTLYLTTSTGHRFILSDYEASLPGNQEMTPSLSKFYWLFIPEDGDAVSDREHIALMITPTGLHFIEPLEFLPEHDAGANVVQDFTFQPDGSLLADDGVTTITAGSPVDYLLDGRNWSVDMNSLSEQYVNAKDKLVEGMLTLTVGRKVTKANITGIRLLPDALEISFSATVQRSNNYVAIVKVDVTKVDDNNIKIAYNRDADGTFDATGESFLKPLLQFDDFMALLCSGNLTVTPESRMNPVKFTTSNSAGSFDMSLSK